jgi:hypothetical protein
MALLEILTRCYKRPAMLAANRAALQRQSSPDWTQTLLVDSDGIGIAATYERLASYEPGGDYVWILDDDDICVYDDLVADLHDIAYAHDPDLVMIKMDHSGFILPDKFTWQKPPQLGHIGVSAFVVKRKIWMRHRSAFVPGCHHSDFNFISDIFGRDYEVYWLDVVASKTQNGAHGGKPE